MIVAVFPLASVDWPILGAHRMFGNRSGIWLSARRSLGLLFVGLTALGSWGTWLDVGTVFAGDEEARQHAVALSRAFRKAAESAVPSVVTVVSKVKMSDTDLRRMMENPRFKRMFPDGLPGGPTPGGNGQGESDGGPLSELNQNVGSGVIIDKAGLVLTNAHVVMGAEEVIVRLQDGTEIKAERVRSDAMSDIAILDLPANTNLPVAKLGDSDRLEIGDWVIAIGSPFELEATVSAGIISGKGRGIEKIRRGKLLQTDAAINPGNSGGPLVDIDGEVVGINTAIATSSGGYQGIGFAIPISRAKWVIKELLDHGKVQRAWLGISIGETSPDRANKLGIPAKSGVLVVDVVAEGPAAEAGLKRNDVITLIGDERVRDTRDLQDAVERKVIGSKQKLNVIRAGKSVSLEVLMKQYPAELEQTANRANDE